MSRSNMSFFIAGCFALFFAGLLPAYGSPDALPDRQSDLADIPASDAVQENRADSSAEPFRPGDLRWVALLTPRRNISAGELLSEADFDQVAVGFRAGENLDRFIPANFAVGGKYAAVDLFRGRNLEIGSIVGETPPQVNETTPSSKDDFKDELAWFSFETLQRGTVVPGYRLQMKRLRREIIPKGALAPDFKPPQQFKVLREINPEQPVLAEQIQILD